MTRNSRSLGQQEPLPKIIPLWDNQSMEEIYDSTKQTGIRIRDWTSRGSGRYRFSGTIPGLGGFWADARIVWRQNWDVTVEGTNYPGDVQSLERLIAAYADEM